MTPELWNLNVFFRLFLIRSQAAAPGLAARQIQSFLGSEATCRSCMAPACNDRPHPLELVVLGLVCAIVAASAGTLLHMASLKERHGFLHIRCIFQSSVKVVAASQG